ncbi:hypothetical protein [Streptomyces sp. NBRC 110028]|nr:hypothetical protein [Streptomyces sp. NBRC 110028]
MTGRRTRTIRAAVPMAAPAPVTAGRSQEGGTPSAALSRTSAACASS